MKEPLRHYSRGVVEVPGRKFPGIVMMGDTLASITSDVADAVAKAKKATGLHAGCSELERLEYAHERLQSHLTLYEHTLRELGLRLPYEPDHLSKL